MRLFQPLSFIIVLLYSSSAAAAFSLSSVSPQDIPPSFAECKKAYSTPLPCDSGCTSGCVSALQNLQLAARQPCASVPSVPSLLRDLQEGRLVLVLCPSASYAPSSFITITTTSSTATTTTANSTPTPKSSPSEPDYAFSGYKTAAAILPSSVMTQTHINTDTDPSPTPTSAEATALVIDNRPSPNPTKVDPNQDLFLDNPVSASSSSASSPGPTVAGFDGASGASGASSDVRWRVFTAGVVVGFMGSFCI